MGRPHGTGLCYAHEINEECVWTRDRVGHVARLVARSESGIFLAAQPLVAGKSAKLRALAAIERPLGRSSMRKIAVMRHRFWSAVTGADIPLGTRIDGGLMLPHPNGIVIHPDATIGPNCLIFQQVTLGGGDTVRPESRDTWISGTGAKILGAVSIGEHAKVSVPMRSYSTTCPRSQRQ